MDSDQGKLFIGGISWETTEDKLNEHFGAYGQVLQSVIMRDKITGRPRGFGFVAFADPAVLDRVLQDSHTIDGRTVEAKRALSREEQQNTSRSGNLNSGRNFGSGGSNVKTKKIFVGGLPPTLSEEEFRAYFEAYGMVTDVVVMYDQTTQRPRGFGFISFDSEESVDRVLHKSFHELMGKLVEVKRALPKDSNPGSGGSRGSGGYQGYGGSNANAGSYDGQTQAPGGAFQGYGSSGYGGQGYGNAAATGGYGAGGYGSAGAGYNGYGNQTAASAGYGGQQGGPRGQWNTQDPSGYGAGAYAANMGYRSETAYGGGSAATGAAPALGGQYSSGASGYGNNEYGYGGNNGYYGNQGGYGAVRSSNQGGNAFGGGSGGEQQATGGGYMGGGYGDASGNYPSQAGSYGASQANGPPGGQGGYGGGYGAAQTRQAQQQ